MQPLVCRLGQRFGPRPPTSSLHPDTRQRLAPLLQRVLIVDSSSHPASLLAGCLGGYGARQTVIEAAPQAALTAAQTLNPTLIFTEAHGDDDLFALIRTLRRSALECRQAPVIVLTTLATAHRWAGVRSAPKTDPFRRP